MITTLNGIVESVVTVIYLHTDNLIKINVKKKEHFCRGVRNRCFLQFLYLQIILLHQCVRQVFCLFSRYHSELLDLFLLDVLLRANKSARKNVRKSLILSLKYPRSNLYLNILAAFDPKRSRTMFSNVVHASWVNASFILMLN